MRNILRIASALIWLSTSGGAARGDILVFAPLKDNTIFQTPAGNSNGQGEQVFAGRSGGSSAARRGLFAFDISSVPAGMQIDRVKLTLRLADVATMEAVPRNMSLHLLTSDWGEGASNAGTGPMSGNGVAAATGDATWNRQFFNTLSWGVPGGDFDATPSATSLVGTLADVGTLYNWETIGSGGLVDDVDDWIADPSLNFGWLLKLDDESPANSVRRFNSGESPTAAFRPQLEIEYSFLPEPAVTPEPSTWLTFVTAGAAALAFACRRRKPSR